jgi:hypothetical protein
MKRHANHANGYILVSLMALLSLVSAMSAAALHRATTDVQILQGLKNITHAFQSAEQNLIMAEEQLLKGVLRTDLVDIEIFQAKGFRKRTGIETTHYKLTASEFRHQTSIELQTIVRIHEKTSSSSKNHRTIERVFWQIF